MSNKLFVIFDVLMGLAVLATGTVLLMIGGILIGLVLGAGTLIARIRRVAQKQRPAAATKSANPDNDNKSPA